MRWNIFGNHHDGDEYEPVMLVVKEQNEIRMKNENIFQQQPEQRQEIENLSRQRVNLSHVAEI